MREPAKPAAADLDAAGAANAAADAVTFVLCIEQNAIRPQALLLCEAIRAFAGRHAHAPILAVAPRPGLGVDRETRDRLDALQVDYVEEPLNQRCPAYGSANRVFTAAWAESRATTEWVIVLDSDTVFLGEPQLPAGDEADVGVRAVDVKGSTTTGPDDPLEPYWTQMAALQGVPLACLPFIDTTDGLHRVRASYNGGLVVARRTSGILRAWADLFSRSLAADLKPLRGSGQNVFASTGHVGLDASEYWGSNQAALALAIWSTTTRVCQLPDAYNMPLHMLRERPAMVARVQSRPPVHVHYHWAFTEPYYDSALATLQTLGTPAEHVAWLRQRLPLR